ncbi:GSCOCG00001222001-RA-CDS, partial [Cotesia congregata]
QVPVERRTLPTDLPGPSRRRTTTKQSPSGDTAMGTPIMGTIVPPGNSGMQTSCSLPETPVFARGSDIPRTPQHTSGNTLSTTTSTMSTAATQPRRQPGWYAPTTATTGGYLSFQ